MTKFYKDNLKKVRSREKEENKLVRCQRKVEDEDKWFEDRNGKLKGLKNEFEKI